MALVVVAVVAVVVSSNLSSILLMSRRYSQIGLVSNGSIAIEC